MVKLLKSLAGPATRPDAAALRDLAASVDPAIPPAVMPQTGSEMVNVRLSSSLVDELDAAAEAEGITRKMVITRALAKAGFRVPQHDLQDRTPKRRRDRRGSG
jgi:hypothetical protein